jgi:UDP-N-acetylglucosamine--N-acetylmuramyl-(pentapeptide) pyrophosphoryl-undecaprenol N-acetylglucosamine transferase
LIELGLELDQVLWVGTKGEMEETLVPRAGIRLECIDGGPIAGVSPIKKVKNGLKLGLGFAKTMSLFRQHEPDVVFMTGGFVAVPVAAAAKILSTPIVVYLPDVEPGSAIKLALRLAKKVASTTEGSKAFVPSEKLVVTGYPVRQELRAAAQLSKAEALSRFRLDPGRQTLFVFGGSRGARSINQALMEHLPRLLNELQVIHVTGHLTWEEVAAKARTLPETLGTFYRPFPYLHEEMGAAFRSADLVLARAGASMLGECPAFGLPSVLVPYPHAWRYQKVNADFLTNRGAAEQLTDDGLREELIPTILGLMKDQKKLAQMRSAARALDLPGAANKLAQLILSVGMNGAQGVTA